MKIIEGDLFKVDFGIIGHQVNCLGVMGGGLAAAIRLKYPNVFKEYQKLCRSKVGDERDLLGTIQIISVKETPPLRICNLFGQLDFGRTEVYTRYDALEKSLSKLKMVNIKKLPVYLPYLLGSDLAGGDWKVVKDIIDRVYPEATVVALPEKAKLIAQLNAPKTSEQ